MPNLTSLTVFGEKICCSWITAFCGRIPRVCVIPIPGFTTSLSSTLYRTNIVVLSVKRWSTRIMPLSSRSEGVRRGRMESISAFTDASTVLGSGKSAGVGYALIIGVSADEVAVTFWRNAALGTYHSGLEEVDERKAS